MKNLVINTQYMENYGSAEKPYMKFKGGTTYVYPNCGDLTQNEAATIVAKIRPYITTTMAETNGGSEEYIIDFDVVKKSDMHVPTWESVTEFNFIDGVNFMRVTDNREDGWRRKEILEVTEAWSGDLESDTKRKDYTIEFLMEDGDFVYGNDGLKEWFVMAKINDDVVLPKVG